MEPTHSQQTDNPVDQDLKAEIGHSRSRWAMSPAARRRWTGKVRLVLAVAGAAVGYLGAGPMGALAGAAAGALLKELFYVVLALAAVAAIHWAGAQLQWW